MSTEIQSLQAANGTGSLLEIISQLANSPNALDKIEVMERLLAMQERVMEQTRKVAFAAAMSRLQAKLPQINKDGRIVVKGTERSRYARIEDIDVAIRPLLADEGFAFSFDTESADGKLFKISCKLSHSEGYAETKSITLPMDASDYRSNVQSIGSTVSYGKRQLIKMHLNLVERLEDDDGNGGAGVITEEQVRDLDAKLSEIGMSKPRFLVYMGVGETKDISAKDWTKAMTAIEAKRQAAK